MVVDIHLNIDPLINEERTKICLPISKRRGVNLMVVYPPHLPGGGGGRGGRLWRGDSPALSSCRTWDSNSCPPDLELGALTKWLNASLNVSAGFSTRPNNSHACLSLMF
jgi:hypothetical protein